MLSNRGARIGVLVCLGLACIAGMVLSQSPRAGREDTETGQVSSPVAAIDVSKIYGKIQFVKSFPNYKVQVVDSFPDLRVQIVNSFPDKSGKWQIVNSFPDFKIQIVDSFPDFKIKYVSSFPGEE